MKREKCDKVIQELPDCPHIIVSIRGPGAHLEAYYGKGLICIGDPKQCQTRLADGTKADTTK